MDKLERILNLTATLLDTSRPLSAEELRQRIPAYPEKLASFRRQFERDKDDLREMGIPLTVEPVPGTDPPVLGYRIHRRDYYLRDPGFTADELAAVHLATSLVKVGPAGGADGLRKLAGLSEEAVAPGPETATAALADLPVDPHLATMFAAVMERRPLSFRYRGQDRVVDPYRIEYQRGHWYLTGREHGSEMTKSYRVDRAEGSVDTGEPRSFDPPPATRSGRPAEPWEFGESDPVVAHLLVDADQAPWVVKHLGSEAIAERRPDGSVVMAIKVSDPAAFRSFVLTFLDHAEVLAPPALRHEVTAWLEAMRP